MSDAQFHARMRLLRKLLGMLDHPDRPKVMADHGISIEALQDAVHALAEGLPSATIESLRLQGAAEITVTRGAGGKLRFNTKAHAGELPAKTRPSLIPAVGR